MKFIIYGLTDPQTQEIRYIGKSSSGMQRPREHLKPTALKKDSYKTRWILSLLTQGVKPEIIVLQVVDSHDGLYELEQHWIKRLTIDGARLTNLTDGGEGTHGYKHTKKTKELLSLMKMGKPGVKGIPSPYKGKRRGPASDEHRSNMRKAQKAIASRPEEFARRVAVLNRVRESRKKKVICSNGVCYPSIADAARDLGLHKPNIIAVLSGKYKQTGGHSFAYGA